MDFLKPPSKWLGSTRFAGRAALMYAVAGACWIVATDVVLNILFSPQHAPVVYQVYKGWAFVAVSAIIAFFALRAALKHVERAQRELADQEQRMRHAIRDVPVMVSALDAGGRVVMWNRECARVTGYQADEIINNPEALSLLYPAPGGREALLAATDASDGDGVELSLLCKDGQTRTVQWHNLSRRFPIAGWAAWGIGEDVTNQRQAEQHLREAHERLSFHVNNSPLAVIEWDSEIRVRAWSKRAEEIFGWTQAEALGKHWKECPRLHEEDEARVEQSIGSFLRAGASRAVIRNRNYHKDGSLLHCEWYNSFSWGEDGTLQSILSQVQDVTARVRAETERATLEAQIQHTQKLESLGVLAGGIAHDFNNLLVGVLGNADMALGVLPEESPARENLRDVVASAQHAAELCKQMLAYSGKGRFVLELVNLNTMVLQLKNLLQASVSKRARIDLHLAPDLLAIEADASQVRQVLMNLIINASEAIGDQDGVITISSEMVQLPDRLPAANHIQQHLPPGPYVMLEVSDTGCGMDEETLERIFDPFFTTKFTGRGLGLAAVLGIVRGHHGGIFVKSRPGEGTTFTLLLPAASTPAPLTQAEDETEHHGAGQVLVVDDEELVRVVAQRSLERAGYEVLMAANGVEAVELARAHRGQFRAILLDMTMPLMNGQETLQAIRAFDAQVPIILTSGYTEEETRRRMGGREFNSFLQKPFRAQELLRAIAEHAQ